jgi:hypothetical protein
MPLPRHGNRVERRAGFAPALPDFCRVAYLLADPRNETWEPRPTSFGEMLSHRLTYPPMIRIAPGYKRRSGFVINARLPFLLRLASCHRAKSIAVAVVRSDLMAFCFRFPPATALERNPIEVIPQASDATGTTH